MKVLKFRNKIIAQKRKKTIKWGEKIKMKKAKFYTAVVTAFQEYGSLCKYRPGRAHCTVIECILSVTLVHAFRYIVHVVRLIL